MSITLTYQPDKGISLGDIFLSWNIERQTARGLVNDKYEAKDTIIDLDGKTNKIIQRRDVYRNYQSQDSFFFLNYNEEDLLIEVEIHHGLSVQIKNILFDFEMDFEEVVALLSTLSSNGRQISNGEYFFKDLKLTVANNEAMGGEGGLLSYFYCTNNIEHLIEN